ncbi:glycosyltransferase family 39 protein [Actibacterium sp. 188UL27-1]|uniref:ArnT family glycosyltransferase n=1 Tax=Actibacterium sp. 188UL27-1 TaxID=2786961 RepID=UPI00195C46B7|nr:glycosyltransferase family 39 protein [Actibacterium sp. 188UL27-1]MBM7070137.1 glycosyltransferase family 39 protein [Actibacterium sp. 188UL27-1]
MSNVAAADRWLPWAVLWVGVITAYRIVMLAFDSTDLFVDEAQYWLWGQDLAFGYYSKPPMIGWVIRLSTEVGGSDAPFWVRLPGAIFHGATALILAAIAAHSFGARAASVAVAVAYATLPVVTVGSFLISTDTVMFPFLALALLCWLRVLGGAGWGWAVTAGSALGLAFLSKYAAAYYVMGAILAAIFGAQARPSWRNAGLGLMAFCIVIAPNILWNLVNGAHTVEHTLDNADWVRDPGTRAAFNWAGLAEFFGNQFIVFGPVFFGALLWLWARLRGVFLWFSLPIVLLVCGQAFLSQAYANWAAAAYLAGTLMVVPWLALNHRHWLTGSLVLHGIFAATIPLGAIFAASAAPDSLLERVYGRYLGQTAFSEAILTAAQRDGVTAIVADNRDVLADLFYTGRDAGLPIYAKPRAGRARNHYELNHSYGGTQPGRVLFVGRNVPDACNPSPTKLEHPAPDQRIAAYVIDGTCWGDP